MNPFATQIAKLLQLAGISTNVPASTLAGTLEANAAQFATLPTNLLWPALIWTLNQTLAKLPGATTGFIYAGNYGSAGPQFIPASAGALAIDTVTRRQWIFAAGTWS